MAAYIAHTTNLKYSSPNRSNKQKQEPDKRAYLSKNGGLGGKKRSGERGSEADIFYPHCDIDLEDSNKKKMSHNTLTCDGEPVFQIWLQNVMKFRRYGRKLFFEDLTLHCYLDLKDRNPTFCTAFRVMMKHNHIKFHEERLSG